MSQLIPIAAVTVLPAVACLAVAYALRGQSGRHTAGIVRPAPPGWNPLTGRERQAVRHYATRQRERYVNTVNTGSAP